MAASSVFTWKFFLVAGAEFLPLAAAWRAGRLRPGDPAGQIGFAWAFMNVCTFIQALGVLLERRDVREWGLVLAGISLPLLLVPPLLTWIGPAAKRRQPWVLGAFALLGVGALAVFGTGREFTLLSRTTAHTGLAALVLLMMATQFRRSADPQAATAEPGWAWIAGGLLAYFLATLVGRALSEALIGRSVVAATTTNRALLVTYAVSMVAIAGGIWRSVRSPARREGAHRVPPRIPAPLPGR